MEHDIPDSIAAANCQLPSPRPPEQLIIPTSGQLNRTNRPRARLANADLSFAVDRRSRLDRRARSAKPRSRWKVRQFRFRFCNDSTRAASWLSSPAMLDYRFALVLLSRRCLTLEYGKQGCEVPRSFYKIARIKAEPRRPSFPAQEEIKHDGHFRACHATNTDPWRHPISRRWHQIASFITGELPRYTSFLGRTRSTM